jgi:nitrate reductase gamma subunit
MSTLLWVVLPYIAVTSFVVGHAWRYRYDKFGWTSRSSELHEKRILAIASPLFHFGMLGVVGGHVIGLLVPEGWTGAVGISEHTYHLTAVVLGTIAGAATVVGLALLIYRRRFTPAVFRVTSPMDKLMFPLLGAVIVLGILNTVGVGVFGMGGHPSGYDYRTTVAVWFRDVLFLHPRATQMQGVPWSFQVHAILALALFALWPYTRLVHVLAAPLGYFTRPYIVYRSRSRVGATRSPRRGWERSGLGTDALARPDRVPAQRRR